MIRAYSTKPAFIFLKTRFMWLFLIKNKSQNKFDKCLTLFQAQRKFSKLSDFMETKNATTRLL